MAGLDLALVEPGDKLGLLPVAVGQLPCCCAKLGEDATGTCAHEPPHVDFNPPVHGCMAGLDLALVEPGDKLALPSVTKDDLIWVRNAGSGLFLDAARAAIKMLGLAIDIFRAIFSTK